MYYLDSWFIVVTIVFKFLNNVHNSGSSLIQSSSLMLNIWPMIKVESMLYLNGQKCLFWLHYSPRKLLLNLKIGESLASFWTSWCQLIWNSLIFVSLQLAKYWRQKCVWNIKWTRTVQLYLCLFSFFLFSFLLSACLISVSIISVLFVFVLHIFLFSMQNSYFVIISMLQNMMPFITVSWEKFTFSRFRTSS